MNKKKFCTILNLLFILGLSQAALAEMISENYRIQNSVQSGGGTATASDNYQMNNTVGQSSPLMDPIEPPISDSYDLFPGFWYTVANVGLICLGDFNGDKDVDGSDLAGYMIDSGGLDLNDFAMDFGKANCP